MMTAPNSSQTPEQFMLEDLMRSGLTPEDFTLKPVPVVEFGVNGYQIQYTNDYHKTRLDRAEDKYIGPKGKQAPVVMIGTFKGAMMTASVEGYKKALTFHIATGIPTFVIDSCDGFGVGKVLSKVIVKNLEPLSKHLVILDGDWSINERVRAALATYITLLDELTVEAIAVDLGSNEKGQRLGFDDWMIDTYGDREDWPDENEVLEDIDTLPKATVSPLDMNMAYTTKSLSLFSDSFIDNSDVGLANLLLKLVGKQNIIYLTDIGQWATWDSGWHIRDTKPSELFNIAALHLRQKVEVLWEQVNRTEKAGRGDDGELTDVAKAKLKVLKQAIAEFEKGLDRCRSMGAIKSILENIADRYKQQQRLSYFDTKPHLLGVPNGVMDLLTGELREEQRDDLISKRCSVDYVEGATHPRLTTFVNEVTSDAHGQPNPERLAVLQARLGAALYGTNKLTAMEIWLGGGSNGKSALASLLSAALGPYAVTVPASTVLSMYNKRDGESSTPQLIRTVGARIVFMAEVKDTDYLDENAVKQITGGDKYTPRGNYQQGAEYDVTFNPILLTNNLPSIAHGDAAIWDRLPVIDFPCRWRRPGSIDDADATLPKADTWFLDTGKRDSDFLKALLAWLIEGAARYTADPDCAVIQDNTRAKEYREDNDVLGQFITEMGYSFGVEGRVQFSEVYNDYKQWCVTQGTNAVKSKVFGGRLITRFPQLEKIKARFDGPPVVAFVGMSKVKKF